MKSFNRIRCLNQAVSCLIEEYDFSDVVVADIGADHGYLAEQLSRNEKIQKIYATDISQKCLEKTNELIAKFHLDKIQTKLGDGLEAINSATIAVMAGIGGYEIINMISNQNITINGEKKCEIFVLQPSKNASELREYLIDNDIAITKDYIIKSAGKFYPIIIADLNKKNTLEKNIFNLQFGHSNTIEDSQFIEFLKDTISRLEVVNNLKAAGDLDRDIVKKIEVYELAKKLINKCKGD